MPKQITSLGMNQKFKKTPLGMIPVDWELATIGNYAKINAATLNERTSPDAIFKYIDISSIEQPGKLSKTTQIVFKEAPSRARRLVRSGDILVSTVRPYLRAFARINLPDNDLVASTGFAVLTPINVDGEYLYQFVLSKQFVKFLEEQMTGSNYPAVNSSDVAMCPLPIPPLNEQKKISGILSAVDA
ncbi:MAG: restriction endonuclease subunit S, partial [Elusimicrobiota bacterium]